MSPEVEQEDDGKDIAEKDRSYLLSYTRHLERKIRTLETEKQLIDNERMRMEREIASMRNDLEQMKRSPLITGTIVDVLENNRAVVRSSSGPSFVVNVIKSINKDHDGVILPGIGIGIRFTAFTDNHMNVGLDAAVGKNDWGIYFRIGEAF